MVLSILPRLRQIENSFGRFRFEASLIAIQTVCDLGLVSDYKFDCFKNYTSTVCDWIEKRLVEEWEIMSKLVSDTETRLAQFENLLKEKDQEITRLTKENERLHTLLRDTCLAYRLAQLEKTAKEKDQKVTRLIKENERLHTLLGDTCLTYSSSGTSLSGDTDQATGENQNLTAGSLKLECCDETIVNHTDTEPGTYGSIMTPLENEVAQTMICDSTFTCITEGATHSTAHELGTSNFEGEVTADINNENGVASWTSSGRCEQSLQVSSAERQNHRIIKVQSCSNLGKGGTRGISEMVQVKQLGSDQKSNSSETRHDLGRNSSMKTHVLTRDCNVCKETCIVEKRNENDLDERGEENVFTCKLCSDGAHGRAADVPHDCSLVTYDCPVCEVVLKSKTQLEIHMMSHNNVKPYKCTICGKGFRTERYLQSHASVHLNGRHFLCCECGKSLRSRKTLKAHSALHAAESPHVCDVCGKACKTSQSLSSHKLLQHADRRYKCGVCERRFPTSYLLQVHHRQHTGERPFSCDICGKTFAEVSKMKRHQLIHNGEKKYACAVCGKGFIRAEHCRSHEATHSGVREYHCDVCEKSFMTQSNLTTHKRIHEGLKPFICAICQRSFAQNSTLQAHVLTHTKVKTQVCDVCGKSFGRKDHLIQHQRVHRKECEHFSL